MVVKEQTNPDGMKVRYSCNAGGFVISITTPDNKVISFSYDNFLRRTGISYPDGVSVSYEYDVLDRIVRITYSSASESYQVEISYHPYFDLETLRVEKRLSPNSAELFRLSRNYDEARRVKEEQGFENGVNLVWHRKYNWDKVARKIREEDVLSGWVSDFTNDASGRLLQIVNTAGTGANPFPWPSGTTTATSDANGNILAMSGTGWNISQEFDYEQRVKRVVREDGTVVENVYDGMGRRVKETVGGAGKDLVSMEGKVLREYDGAGNLMAQYFWAGFDLLQKDLWGQAGVRYFVPDGLRTPFSSWDQTGGQVFRSMYNSFGVATSTTGTNPTAYEWMGNWRNGASHGTLTFKNAFYYPELGRNLQGRFSLTFFNGGVRPQPCLVEVTIGPGLPGGGEGGYGCGGVGIDLPPGPPDGPPVIPEGKEGDGCPKNRCVCDGCPVIPVGTGTGPGNCVEDPVMYCAECLTPGGGRKVCKFSTWDGMMDWVESQRRLCKCGDPSVADCCCPPEHAAACYNKKHCVGKGINACDMSACLNCEDEKIMDCVKDCWWSYVKCEIGGIAYCTALCAILCVGNPVCFIPCEVLCHAVWTSICHATREDCEKDCHDSYNEGFRLCLSCSNVCYRCPERTHYEEFP